MANMMRCIACSHVLGMSNMKTRLIGSLIDTGQSNATVLRYSSPDPTKLQKTMPQDQYQTVKEVADRLKVAEATVRHWIKEGQLRAIDIGKSWRIADSDLADFLAPTRPHRRSRGRSRMAVARRGMTSARPDLVC